MQSIIQVTVNEKQEPVVSGRQLYEALGVNSNYTTWFDRMTDYGFIEGQDFLPNLEKSTGGRRAVDHIIKLDMAKEIAMIQRTEKGKQIRQYFIQVEKDFNSPEKIMARALLMADKKVKLLEQKNQTLEVELEQAQKQARYLDLIIESKGGVTVTQIAADYGMSAKAFNIILHNLGIQHSVNKQWVLYRRHMAKGYTDSRTMEINGRVRMSTTWTQKGRLFLYEILKDNDILPLIEQVDDVV